MSIRDANWYARNGRRAYPLDDAATGIDDSGSQLPPGILVDASIRFPRVLGRCLYLSAVAASRRGVSLLLLCGPDPIRMSATDSPGVAGGFLPIASVSVPSASTPFEAVAVESEIEGVGGWVVFGDIEDLDYSGRFSTPEQSALLTRCARPYTPAPIPALTVLGGGDAYSGIVAIKAGGDLTVTYESRTIGGSSVDAVIFSLRDALGRNASAVYAGPCGARPESGTCPRPAITRVNGVAPDCDGNIEFVVTGADTVPFAVSGGLALVLPHSVSDLCGPDPRLPDSGGELPNEPVDPCAPPAPLWSMMSPGVLESGPPDDMRVAANFTVGFDPVLSIQSGSFIGGGGYAEGFDAGESTALWPRGSFSGRRWFANVRRGGGFYFKDSDEYGIVELVTVEDDRLYHRQSINANETVVSFVDLPSSGLTGLTLDVSTGGRVVAGAGGLELPPFHVDPFGDIGIVSRTRGGEIGTVTRSEIVDA